MRKTIAKIMSGHNNDDILTLFKKEKNARVQIRLLALLYLQEKKRLKDVVNLLHVTEPSVREWVHSYHRHGYEGLIEDEGRGRLQRLPKEKEKEFIAAVEDLQKEKKGGRVTGYDIQKILHEKFDVSYSVDGVYVLMDRLNLVWITARSKHPKNSQKAMDTFKSSFPEEVKKNQKKV
ncbi:MAG: winged helix-turn-helix domain-containing protein [Pseudomonadota bacterium]